MEALAEDVGVGGMDLRVLVGDLVDGHEELVGVVQGLPTELPAVVGQDVLHRNAPLLVEGEEPVVEEIDGRHGQLGEVGLREGQGAERVHHALEGDPPHPLDGPDVVGVLAEVARGAARPPGRPRLSCIV